MFLGLESVEESLCVRGFSRSATDVKRLNVAGWGFSLELWFGLGGTITVVVLVVAVT